MNELIYRVGWEPGWRGWGEEGGRRRDGEVVGGTGGVHIVVHVQVKSAKVVGWRVSVLEERKLKSFKVEKCHGDDGYISM